MEDSDTPEQATAFSDHEQTQNKIINEEYKVWKKNSVFLYDVMYSRALEWPTLTTQWLPDVAPIDGRDFNLHRLILGTHTSGQATDYLQIAHIELPKAPALTASDYNPATEELGGHGASKDPMKFSIYQKITHPGEVNKARYQPQNHDIIATWAVDKNLYVWDRTKQPLIPRDDVARPQAVLKGHTAEGFALEWSPAQEGHLLSGGEDKTVCLWDLPNDYSADAKVVRPSRRWTHHSATVNDVQFHPKFGTNLFGSVSDDLTIQIVDMRKPTNEQAEIVFNDAHSDAINTLAFHPTIDTLLASGSADKTIGIFDLRFAKQGKIHNLEGHLDMITKVDWHPKDSAILASSADDRRVIFWDLSAAGQEQTPEDAEDGPPEMLFMHGGHTNRVSDFSWNVNDSWVMASAADDNLLQIWRPSRNLVEKLPPSVLRSDISDG